MPVDFMSERITKTLLVLVGLIFVAFVLSQIASSTRSQIWTLETGDTLDRDLEAATTNILRRRALGLHPAFSPIVRGGKGGVFSVRVRGALPVESVAEEVLTRGGIFSARPISKGESADSGRTPVPSLIGNEDIVDARVKIGEDQRPRVDIRLAAPAQARVAEFFRQNPSGRLALAVDGQIGARATAGELSGPLLAFDPGWKAEDGNTAFALAAILDGGPLPVALRVRPASRTSD
jgi:hypothetical protein